MALTDPRPKPPDDTIHLAFNGQQSSMTWAIIMWLKVTAATRTGTDLATLLTAIGSAWSGSLGQQLVATASLTELKGVWIIPGGGEIVGSDTTVRGGSHAGTQMPNLSTCAVINWRVDKYYRGGKPRTYMPGVAEAVTSDFVHLSTTEIANYQTRAATFRNSVNALTAGAITDVKLGTVSFVSKGDWRVPPEFWPFNGASVRSVIGTQRRRLLT